MPAARADVRHSIDDEELGTRRCVGPVRLGVVGHLVADPWRERERAAVVQLGVQLALQAKQDMSLDAPVVRQVAGRVLDHAHANAAEGPRAPGRDAGDALVFRGFDLGPIGGTEWDAGHLQRGLLVDAIVAVRFEMRIGHCFAASTRTSLMRPDAPDLIVTADLAQAKWRATRPDRKSTRLNSSHSQI